MRNLTNLAMLLLFCAAGGCSTVKWTQPDKLTGGTWMIKQNPLTSDTIYYCPPPARTEVHCMEATTR